MLHELPVPQPLLSQPVEAQTAVETFSDVQVVPLAGGVGGDTGGGVGGDTGGGVGGGGGGGGGVNARIPNGINIISSNLQ